jgi:hypothetical protein
VLSTAVFFLCLTALAGFIWLLSLVSSVVSEDDSEDAPHRSNERAAADKFEDPSQHQHGVAAIADAINTYSRNVYSQERHRAKREKATIVALFAAAIFAFLAAIAAIASALIFAGQLNEMQRTGTDARTFSQAQLRAYITVTGVEIERGDPNRNIGGMLESRFWIIRPKIENSGSTPSRDLRWIMSPSVTLVSITEIPSVMPKVEKDQAASGGWTYGNIGPRAIMTLDYLGNRMGLLESVFLQIARGAFRQLFTGVSFTTIFFTAGRNM